LTPAKDAKQDQWWDASPSEYVVDTTITNDTNPLCWLSRWVSMFT